MQENFVYVPDRDTIEKTNIMKFARKSGLSSLASLYDRADTDQEWFWNEVVRDTGIEFFSPYEKVMDLSSGKPWGKWFVGGRVNISYNAVERYRDSEKPAVKYEKENGERGAISFRDLDQKVGRLAGSLLKSGISKGERIGIYMPLSVESVIAMYAIMRIGAVAVPMFSGYGREAVISRIEDAGIRHMFVTASFERRGKKVDLLSNLRNISGLSLIVSGRAGEGAASMDDMISGGDYVKSVETDSEDPAIMLYTSGTTGKPKGTVHVHGGPLVNIAKEVKYYMDMGPDDTLFWISDPGWMMGPWSMIGANVLGGSIFVYDGALDYPEKDRLWKIVEENGITLLGVSPTLIRTFRASGLDRPLSGIRCFGSTGEPWDTESWMFLFQKLGNSKVPICNISGGTDIIGCFLASHPAIPLSPRCLYRGLGMNVAVYDESGNRVFNRIGYLVAMTHLPPMTRGLWNAREKYIETYWSRFRDVWFHGDWAEETDDGYFYLYGRADDVIKIAGKRVGPGEIEDIASAVTGVRECAAAGIPDNVKGEAIAVFYTGDGRSEVQERIRKAISSKLGKPFAPKYVVNLDSLPKTRNGKIMRRIARNAFLGADCGDVSSLEDPAVVEKIRSAGNDMMGGKNGGE